jgi:uncharacterized protein (DUF2062 family)/SAM-dependent methyltransferase
LFREELRRVWRELRGPELSPSRGAAAVALGLFIGSQPIFGCHTPLVIVLCLWFRLDGAIAWVASNVSNPFFAPALLTAEVQVGAWLRTGSPIRFDVEVARLGAWEFLTHFGAYAFVGAPLVGLGLALAGAAGTYGGVVAKRALWPARSRPEPYRLPEGAPAWVQAVERAAMRFAPPEESTPAQRTRFHYVRWKLLGDPVARLIADVAGEEPDVLGEVVDVGTGAGQLPILLLELGRATRARGVDWDETKIADARAAAASRPEGREPLDATFEKGDARTFVIDAADTVLLIDLIHYFTIEEQDAIVRGAAKAVRPGGRLIVREADTERGLRSLVTLMEERIFTTLRFNRGERVRFRPAREIVAILEELGLSCRLQPAWGKTPFSNVLIIGERGH